jgi:hypothetical protein
MVDVFTPERGCSVGGAPIAPVTTAHDVLAAQAPGDFQGEGPTRASL